MEDERIETRWFTKKELRRADRDEQDPRCEDDDRLPVLGAALSRADGQKKGQALKRPAAADCFCSLLLLLGGSLLERLSSVQPSCGRLFRSCFLRCFFVVAIVGDSPCSHYETKTKKDKPKKLKNVLECGSRPNRRVVQESVKKIQLITDGACLGNPGPGGWAAILRYGAHKKEIFGCEAAHDKQPHGAHSRY